MKAITKFQAADGREFVNPTDCADYDERIEDANRILAMIPAKPKLPGCGFENGEGFIQHEPPTFARFKLAILEAIRPHFSGNFADWVDKSIAGGCHPSWVGRLLDESDDLEPYRKAWSRVYCTDGKFREWGQPFYALNPDKGTQKRLNP